MTPNLDRFVTEKHLKISYPRLGENELKKRKKDKNESKKIRGRSESGENKRERK